MTGCIFCKIIAGELPSTKVFRDEQVTAFRDLHPITPTHILIVPNMHIDSVNALTVEDEQLIGHLFTIARQIAAEEGIAESGYRLVTNTNAHAGQSVFHIHLHLLGGAPMKHAMG
jgi:histidine triad (HIT) family protein